MGFNCGIVGLPNVGKSTLFNALLSTQAAEAANYPFCTIEPNVGRVAVPDERITTLASIAQSAQIIPTQLEFVDIAGLVRGASKGEGLGNKFLAHIREVDAIIYMLRCFEDGDITHVEGRIDPLADAEIIETELVLADLESLEKRLPALQKKMRGDKDAMAQAEIMEKLLKVVAEGNPARSYAPVNADEAKLIRQMQLLTAKPVLYVCNVEEASAATGNAFSAEVQKKVAAPVVIISARIESEVAILAIRRRKEANFLEAHRPGSKPASPASSSAGYALLGPDYLLHRRPQGNPRLGPCIKGCQSPAGGGRHPQRISKKASSAPKPLPMATMSPVRANRVPRKRASCVWKARNIRYRTATYCISGLRIRSILGGRPAPATASS